MTDQVSWPRRRWIVPGMKMLHKARQRGRSKVLEILDGELEQWESEGSGQPVPADTRRHRKLGRHDVCVPVAASRHGT